MPITHIIHSITRHNNIFCSPLVTPLHISAFMKTYKKLIKASKLSTCIDGNTTPKYELTFNAYILDAMTRRFCVITFVKLRNLILLLVCTTLPRIIPQVLVCIKKYFSIYFSSFTKIQRTYFDLNKVF